MDTATFWSMIETAKAASDDNCSQQARILKQELVKFPPEEIQGFDQILWQQMRLSYDNDLWAAAFIAQDGCSDDAFMDFQGWLIAQGEAIFHSVLQNTDTLANIVEPPPEPYKYACMEMLSIAWRAYQIRTGQEMPPWEPSPFEIKGEPWDEEELPEKCAKRFPNLWATLGW